MNANIIVNSTNTHTQIWAVLHHCTAAAPAGLMWIWHPWTVGLGQRLGTDHYSVSVFGQSPSPGEVLTLFWPCCRSSSSQLLRDWMARFKKKKKKKTSSKSQFTMKYLHKVESNPHLSRRSRVSTQSVRWRKTNSQQWLRCVPHPVICT